MQLKLKKSIKASKDNQDFLSEKFDAITREIDNLEYNRNKILEKTNNLDGEYKQILDKLINLEKDHEQSSEKINTIMENFVIDLTKGNEKLDKLKKYNVGFNDSNSKINQSLKKIKICGFIIGANVLLLFIIELIKIIL